MPDGHAVALEYVRSGAILTDLLAIIPTILQVKIAPATYRHAACRRSAPSFRWCILSSRD